MTDLTLNDFRDIPEDKIRKMLRQEAEKICQKDLTKKECMKKEHSPSHMLKSPRQYSPKYPLSVNRS